MDSNSTTADGDISPTPRNGIVKNKRSSYLLIAVVVFLAIATLVGRLYLKHAQVDTAEHIEINPTDTEDPLGFDTPSTLPKLPKPRRVEKPVNPNDAELDKLKEENKQIRLALLELRKETIRVQRQAGQAAAGKSDTPVDPYAKWRSSPLTIDYSTVPESSVTDGNGLSQNGDGAGHVPKDASKTVKFNNLNRWIKKGTQIPVLPITPINTEVGGQVIGRIDEDIYSRDGECLLIPKWSTALGLVKPELRKGGSLIRLTWTEIQAEDGTTLYTESQGGNSVGQPGIKGQIDHKTAQRFFWPLLFSLLSVEADSWSNSRGRDIAITSNNAVSDILDRTLDIEPTAYVPYTDQIVTLIVTNDWQFQGPIQCL